MKSALICAVSAWTALASSGCATTGPTGTAAQICETWRPIGVRKGDVITDPTAREIIGNNEARHEWCSAKKV